jgi:hypothetical protein
MLKEYLGKQTVASLIRLILTELTKYVKHESLDARISPPSTNDNGKYVRVINGKYVPSELDTAFIAEYKVTTYADLKAAWDKGQKHMLLRVTGNNIEWLAPLYCWEPAGFSFRLIHSTQEKIWWCSKTSGWSSKFVSIPTVQSTQEYIDQQLGVIENGSY